jgi:hypothetical protein
MKNNLKYIVAVLLITIIGFLSCKKTEYSFGNIKTPSSLTLTSAVAGVDATNPNGNGTGTVTITTLATDALTYNIDFGDGKTQVVPSGVITYKYTTPGVNDYLVTVKAVGTGGSVSVISKKVTVYVAFTIPQAILDALTGSGSRTWITDKDAPGHFGIGPADGFSPNWYAATPNSREACAYDDEITFSKDANNNISMAINNKGQSFSIGAASSFYGFSGADACFNIVTTGIKKLAFMDATSASTSAVSTRIQFNVPGNGIINFGTGGTNYEILSATATNIHLRNIGADGNAWYQKLKAK